MPREIFFFNQNKKSLWEEKTTKQPAIAKTTDSAKLREVLRRPRSEQYLDAIKKVDLKGQKMDPKILEKIKELIEEEFPEVPVFHHLLGIVAKCYLGRPYEVHTLDFCGSILKHFKSGEALPGKLEQARSLAMHGSYAFIEVYTDCMRAIKENGEVSVVGG